MTAVLAAANEQLLDVLKYALLALLYLFFARVLWAVWSEVRGPRPGRARGRATTADMAHAGVYTGADTAGSTVAATLPTDPTVAASAPGDQHAQPAPPRAKRAVKGRRGQIGRLVVYQPRARRGAAYPLAEEITVGRAPSASVSMPDDTFVSQLHARIFRRDGLAWLEDLGSTNGTFLNGRRIDVIEQLSQGDRVQIGNTVFEAE